MILGKISGRMRARCSGSVKAYSYTGACGNRIHNQTAWNTWTCFYGHVNYNNICSHTGGIATECDICVAENFANAGWNYYPMQGCAVQVTNTGYKCDTCGTTYQATGSCTKETGKKRDYLEAR